MHEEQIDPAKCELLDAYDSEYDVAECKANESHEMLRVKSALFDVHFICKRHDEESKHQGRPKFCPECGTRVYYNG